VKTIAEKARELVTEVDESDEEEKKSAPPPSIAMIQQLISRVVHDHTHSAARVHQPSDEKKAKTQSRFILDMSKRKRGVKMLSKQTLNEARYLLNEVKLPLT
jgi:hypothetical protein